MQEQTPSPIRGWTVVIGALGVSLIIGALYAWSVMGKALVGQWQWTKTQAMLLIGAALAFFLKAPKTAAGPLSPASAGGARGIRSDLTKAVNWVLKMAQV